MSVTDAHMGILQVVYEDGHMACVVKPAGMPTAQVNSICRSYHSWSWCAVVTLSICRLHALVAYAYIHNMPKTVLLSKSSSCVLL